MSTQPALFDHHEKTIKNSILFSGISLPALQALVREADLKTFSAHQQIVQELTRVEGLHVILEGTATVKKGPATLTTLGKGSFFGEISLFGASFGATATIVAHENISVLLITPKCLKEWGKKFLAEENAFLRNMCIELARRLYATSQRAVSK